MECLAFAAAVLMGIAGLRPQPATGQDNWEQAFKLLAEDGTAEDRFGWSAAINGDTIIVGAYGDKDNGVGSGSVYVFDITTGEQVFKLLPDDGELGDAFGYSVAISGNTAIVGAVGDDDRGVGSGSAYVFDITTGEQLFKLLPNDGEEGDWFGHSLATNGEFAIVGAPYDDDDGSASGSAYVFDTCTGEQLFKLLPDDGAAREFFGSSIAIDGNTTVIGAVYDHDNGVHSGSAYVFHSVVEACLALSVDNLIADRVATFTVTNGTPGARAVTVYGLLSGETIVTGTGGYCATFGINSVTQNKVIGGLNQAFDANGEITFNIPIPSNVAGVALYFQSAERGTCPDGCMSNLVTEIVQ